MKEVRITNYGVDADGASKPGKAHEGNGFNEVAAKGGISSDETEHRAG